MRILDVGCGKKKLLSKNDQVLGIDQVKLPGVDYVHDLNKLPWPVRKEYFDLIICNHVLEHLDDVVGTMNEIWRIMKTGAVVRIKVPYHTSPGASTDPTHKHFFAYRSFDYFSNNGQFDFYTKFKFNIISNKIKFHKIFFIFEKIFNKFPRFYERFFRYLIPAEELIVELKK